MVNALHFSLYTFIHIYVFLVQIYFIGMGVTTF